MWRLTLRPRVTFSDGAPFNAEMVKFTVERGQTAELSKSYLAAVASVNVVDNATVEPVTTGPSAAVMRNLSVAILSMVSPQAAQQGDDSLVTNPVGTGPFRLKECVPKERIVVEGNPTYWGEPALLDQITFFPIPDDSTRLTSYQAGDLDVVINPPLEAVESLRSDPDSQVAPLPATRTVWLGFNVGDGTLKNEQVRQAIAAVVDRWLLVETVTENLMREAVALVPPEILQPSFELPYPFDPAAARQLLADAGLGGGVQLKFWTLEGRYPKDRQIAEAILGMLSEIGIAADLSVVEWGPDNDALARHEQQLYLIGWGSTCGDPDGGLRQIASSRFAGNQGTIDRRTRGFAISGQAPARPTASAAS